MFTGIIEELGTVKEMKHASEQSVEMTLSSTKIMEDVHVGDSISVNGICLTVTNYSSNDFQVDVMPETIKSTSLNVLTEGSKVNLERSMAANGRFGGHFVSGHVDGIGKITRKQKQENAIYYDIEIPEELAKYFMMKGSVAVDGISLTVFDVGQSTFTISLIPHTVEETILGDKDEGDVVNIECDMLAKHVQNLLNHQLNDHNNGFNQAFLNRNGLI
ncbi:riboflavin synthase alpha chain [Virgibacillus subterraneus]|uniref:Riboflavin synthase n=1 Tax=Virgibacillus subterraneus TaxID=621109 RepID=A0A1H9JCE6_9BACI|nr:riboflavin synthase [Virgibacillus subterraneus]SEQ84506.1 riboflavin synthase alpha chain [Virgibacillus subterraneus]